MLTMAVIQYLLQVANELSVNWNWFFNISRPHLLTISQARLCIGESRIIFLPKWSSIWQYPPKISAININKQSRARLLLAHPVLYILKIQKTYSTFWKPPFQNQPKSVRLQATYGNLHYLRNWFRQCNLSNLSSSNVTPHRLADPFEPLNSSLAQSAGELGRWQGNWKLLFFRPKSKYEYHVGRLYTC